ncbi:MAG TPA: peptide-methionine (R)-S-oxide reductase MsrB [Pyrinomonadaceae bacterium]|nr:peptide-methionine (R)-S-oxide reductase MsrB [Acidobacteriota bacterium]HQZ94783.1 peptide-methionine (R)-S-oxide reductase MsrB [Pyrinomonadaceae bacterium]
MKKLGLSVFILTAIFSVFGYIVAGSFLRAAAASNGISAEPSPTPAKTKKADGERELILIDSEFDGKELVKSDAEWKRELSASEFYVLRQEGTERPYSSPLNNVKKNGTFYCNACGLALFSSKAKFESGTGWPSFFEPIFKKNVKEKIDRSLAEERIEVECARCHSHLGHVFDDGPQPTGLRYCMNGVALRFKAAK